MADVPISANVTVNASVASASVETQGFGTVLLLSAEATSVFAGGIYVQEYSTLAELEADGFSTTGETYLAAASMLAQAPHPPTFKVGAIEASYTSNVQTITWDGDFVTGNTITGSITINGTVNNLSQAFTVDHNSTIAALEVQIEALTGLTSSVSAARQITITSDPDIIYNGVASIGTFTVAGGASQAVDTIATSVAGTFEGSWLATIVAADDDFYGVCYPSANSNSTADANKIYRTAAYLESLSPGKIFLAGSAQSTIATGAAAAITTLLAALGYNRTAIIYHETPTEFLAEAWAAKVLARDIDTKATQWARVNLTGITADDLSTSERAAIVDTDSHGSYYARQAGSNRVFGATMASGRHIDQQTTLDLTVARLGEGLLGVLNRAVDAGSKIPYTNAGVATLETEIRAVMLRLQTAGHFEAFIPTDNLRDWLTVPDVADATAGQRAARTLPPFYITRTFAGAVYSITLNVVGVE